MKQYLTLNPLGKITCLAISFFNNAYKHVRPIMVRTTFLCINFICVYKVAKGNDKNSFFKRLSSMALKDITRSSRLKNSFSQSITFQSPPVTLNNDNVLVNQSLQSHTVTLHLHLPLTLNIKLRSGSVIVSQRLV